jgi:hypothetical protein
MSHPQELSTQKYLFESLEQEIKQQKRARDRKAIRDFLTFLMGLVAIACGTYAVEQMPIWLPVVKQFVPEIGHYGLR